MGATGLLLLGLVCCTSSRRVSLPPPESTESEDIMRTLGIPPATVLWRQALPLRTDWRQIQTVTLDNGSSLPRILALSVQRAHMRLPIHIPDSEIFLENQFLGNDTNPQNLAGQGRRALAPRILPRGAWLWAPAYWQNPQPRLWKVLADFGVNEVFVTFPDSYLNEKDIFLNIDIFTSFLKKCYERNIKTFLVKGSPEAVGGQGKVLFLERIQRLQTLAAQNHWEDLGFQGFQFDVEPWLLGQWGTQKKQILMQLSSLYEDLSRIVHRKVECLLPYWMVPHQPEYISFFKRLHPVVERLTVMNYQTVTSEFKRRAADFFDWGKASGVRVRIAVENGALEPERSDIYIKNDQGSIALVGLKNRLFLVGLREELRVPLGHPEVSLFSYLQTLWSDVKRTTLHGWKPLALENFLRQLDDDWVLEPAFDGIAVHGLDGFVSLPEDSHPLQKQIQRLP